MRVSITGESDLIQSLSDTDATDLKVESLVLTSDETELQFGLVEVATIVTIVTGAVKLAITIHDWWEKSHKEKKQTLRLASALGTVTLELSENLTVEELHQLVEPLFAVPS